MNNGNKSHYLLTEEQISMLSSAGIIPPGTPPAMVNIFAVACQQYGLSPFKKEIYLVRYETRNGSQYHTIVGIEGLQKKAATTGQFAGCDVEKYDLQSDGTFKTASELKAANQLPKTCTVTVYRLINGVKCSFTATAVFEEYYPAPQKGKALTMPFNMIAKCARAKALKIAFSDELAGLHIEEERAAFEDTTLQAANAGLPEAIDVEELKRLIAACQNTDELLKLYRSKEEYKNFADMFTARKTEIQTNQQ